MAGAIVVYFVLYNSGYAYWSGGWSYGPRFLARRCRSRASGWEPSGIGPARGLRTVAVALIVIGGVFTFGAVATNPQLPMSVASPFTDVVVPAVQHDAVACGTQSYLDATPDRAVPTHHDRDAWNLGLLMGLPGWWSVLPLVAVGARGARFHSGGRSTGTPST